jgi:hypothetical protein
VKVGDTVIVRGNDEEIWNRFARIEMIVVSIVEDIAGYSCRPVVHVHDPDGNSHSFFIEDVEIMNGQ